MKPAIISVFVVGLSVSPLAFQASRIGPAPIKPSDLVVSIESVGRMPQATNAASPVVVGKDLLLVDQAGSIYRWDGSTPQPLLSSRTAPAALKLVGSEAVLNVAANEAGNVVYVVFTATSAPRGVPSRKSTRPGADAWQVFYKYDFAGGALSNAKAFAALEVRSDGHTGGGLAALADGSVLFATGDNGDAGEDGRAWAQDPSSHLGKILRIYPGDGRMTVVAAGVRNVQRLSIGPREGEVWLDFVDMGGSVAEEFNSIRLTDLLQDGQMKNFGWGRHADGRAREGSFHIDAGGAAQRAIGMDEPGFVRPVAEFGREGAAAFGASGPVSSDVSFRRISALMADLPGGGVFAITGSRAVRGQDVFRVALRDSGAKAVTLKQLARDARPDPRFFNFPDGTAGVLLEQTGEFFRLTEARESSAPVPVARDGFFDSNGVRIHYVEQGSGPAVILIHELDGGIRTWTESGIFQDLARDHRVVALDVRGHGLSGKPRDPAAYGIEMARDVSRLMDHLSIPRAHIVGYSMGAEVLTMLLVSEPARVASASLIAGAGRFRAKPTDDQHMEEEALEFVNFGVSPTLFLEQTPEGTPEPTVDELKAALASTIADPGRDTRALAAFSRARPARRVTSEQIAAVRVPTIGIAGTADPDVDELRALVALRPDVTLIVVKGAMHAGRTGVLRHAECLAGLRAFLAAHPSNQ
jgi:pimeloyl-ACP methyl ester carboxylesterase